MRMQEYKPVTSDILLIFSSHNSEEPWSNPGMENYIKDETLTPSTINEGFYDGSYMRVRLETKDKNWYEVVTLLNKDVYDKLMDCDLEDDSIVNQIVEEVQVLLGEDVWVVGGEQFAFTDLGKKFRDIWNVTSYRVSPDVVLERYKKGDWMFST